MITIASAVREVTQQLSTSESPRLDAELLVAHCLNVDRATIFREPERRLPPESCAKLSKMATQREQGIPLAQLTGHTEFWSIKLKVNEQVLIPRPETELLVDECLNRLDDTPRTVLEIGAGSGAVAIAIAKNRPGTTVLAVDISIDALAVASQNCEQTKLRNVFVHQSSWLDAIAGNSLDMVVSNPPYIESSDVCLTNSDIRFEPKLALDGGADGLNAYREIIPAARTALKPGGYLLLEHGWRQAPAIRSLLDQSRFKEIETLRDLAGHDRVTLALRP